MHIVNSSPFTWLWYLQSCYKMLTWLDSRNLHSLKNCYLHQILFAKHNSDWQPSQLPHNSISILSLVLKSPYSLSLSCHWKCPTISKISLQLPSHSLVFSKLLPGRLVFGYLSPNSLLYHFYHLLFLTFVHVLQPKYLIHISMGHILGCFTAVQV